MSILDKVKQQMQAPAQQPANLGGQTQTVRGLLQAKTGKQVAPTSGPQQSSIKERMAQKATQDASKQVQQTGQIQAAQIGEREADIEQRQDQQQVEFEENLANATAQFDRQSDSIMNQFFNGQKSLQNSKDIADLEQLGFIARLDNKQYIDALQLEGQKKRLSEGQNFKLEMAKTVFADSQDFLKDDLQYRAMMDMDDRAWNENLANMDINKALEFAEAENKQANAEMMAKGTGDAFSSFLSYWEKNPDLFNDEKGNANTNKPTG